MYCFTHIGAGLLLFTDCHQLLNFFSPDKLSLLSKSQSKNMSSEIFKIDTKGKCLLCFSECTNGDRNRPPTTPAFKMLLRYLQIDLMKLGHFSSAFRPFLSGPDSVNISVNLCQYCSSVTTDFLQLFQDFERIRLMLDNCAGKLHKAMEEGDNDVLRVREYRNRVLPVLGNSIRPEDALQASVAEILRKETMAKCARRLAYAIPRILIKDELSPKTPQKTMPATVCRNTKIDVNENLVNVIKSETLIPSLSTQADVDFLHLEDCDDGVDDNPSLQMQDPLEICDGSFEGSNAVLEFETQSQIFKEGDKKMKNHKSFKDMKKNRGNTTHDHKCRHCYKTYPNGSSLKSHIIMIHTFLHFSNRLPPGTTEQQLKSSIQLLLSKTRQLRNTDSGKLLYGCILCNKSFPTMYMLQRHVLWVHFDVIVKNYLTNDNPFLNRSQNDVQNETSSLTVSGSGGIEHEKLSKILKFDPETPSTPTTSTSPNTNDDENFDDLEECGDTVDDNPSLQNEESSAFCNVVFQDATDEETRSQILTNTNGAENDKSSTEYLNDSSCTDSLKQQCPHCSKSYPAIHILKEHLAMVHTLKYFSNQLPFGTTEQQLQAAIQEFLAKLTKVPNPVNTKSFLFECQWCRKLYPRKTFGFQRHVFMMHFDEFVNTFLADNSTKNQDKIVVNIDSADASKSEILTFDEDSDVEIDECSSVFPAKDPLAPEEDSSQINPAPEQKQSTTLQFFASATPTDNPASASSMSALAKSIMQAKRRNRPSLRTGVRECKHCGKVLRNLNSLQCHIREFHSKVRKLFMCNHCNQMFTRQNAVRKHAALEHTFTCFKNRFPSGTTEDEFKNVVDKLVAQPREICVDEGGVLTTKLGCQYCEKIFHQIHPGYVRLVRKTHFVQSHLDKIINILEQEKVI